MVATQNIPYTVSIDPPSIENIEQRAQVSHNNRIYDINWDSAAECVVTYYTEEGEPLWFEIRCDDTVPQDITLACVLMAFGCISPHTIPILTFPLDMGYTIENYLVTPVSTDFLMQMSVISVPIEEDPTPTSSDNESIEEDSDDNPVINID